MKLKKSYFIPLLIGFLFSGTMAQDRTIIMKNKIVDGDSIRQEITITDDGDFEWVTDENHENFIFHDGHVRADSLMKSWVFTHSGDVEFIGDSALQPVHVMRIPRAAPVPSRVIIKKSGLFRKSTIIIDFDPMTQEILQVIDNDENIPAKKLHKYQDYLEDAIEYSDWEALHPRMEEMEFKINMMSLADSEKLAELETLIIDLESLESERAHLKKEHFTSIKRFIEFDVLTDAIQNILSENGQTPPQKIKEIAIKKGKFFLNGEEIKGELGKKCIQAYATHAGFEEDYSENGDDITIEITLD